jgi:hydroxyacylglutathione hydrolase
MSLSIHCIPLGPLETNSYAVASGEDCWLIDVGMWSKPMLEYLRDHDLAPQRILLTHGHGDHIGGVEYLKQHFPDARLACPRADEPMLKSPERNLSATFLMGIEAPDADDLLEPGQSLELDGFAWKVLDTSGHTPGGVSFYCPAKAVVFTGDSLFARNIGRSDIPDGDHERLLTHIRENLLTLPEETRVYPGHGPSTTVGEEKAHNPFV